jgi:hypothetical protein
MNRGKHFFQKSLEAIAFDRPHLLRSLIVFPLFIEDGGFDGGSLTSLHDAMGGKQVEILDSGTVEVLKLINRSDRLVIGIDGQEVRGGLQNRILTSSVLIGARSEKSLPALCVEQGRWKGTDPHFNQGTIAYPSLRTQLARSTIHKKGNAQHAVWSSIQESLKKTGTYSATSSMADLFASFEEELTTAAGQLTCEEGQTGAAVVIGGRYLCIDAFSSSTLFQSFFPLLARSYAIDALSHRGGPMEWRNLEHIPAIVHSLAEHAHEVQEQGVALGEHVMLHSDAFQGRALVYNNQAIHLSSFAEL